IKRLEDVEEVELPPVDPDRIHAWHLFPIRLKTELLTIDRDCFVRELGQAGVACSVHWRPLHLHPYYKQQFHWRPSDLPVASAVWARLVSLPLFSGMRRHEIDLVVNAVRTICTRSATRSAAAR